MPAKLKRTRAIYPSGSYRNPKNKSKIYRSPRSSYGTTQRSGYLDLAITNKTNPTFGFALNSSGFYVNDTLTAWFGATDIGNAYDAYRITKCVIEFTYNNNNSNVSQVTTTLPWLFTAVDYDDAGGSGGATIAFNTLIQKDGARIDNFGTNGGMKVIRTFVPKIAIAAYATSVTTGYMEPKSKQWVSTGSIGTGDPKHYGLWAICDDSQQTTTTGTNGYLRCFVKCFFELKHAQ